MELSGFGFEARRMDFVLVNLLGQPFEMLAIGGIFLQLPGFGLNARKANIVFVLELGQPFEVLLVGRTQMRLLRSRFGMVANGCVRLGSAIMHLNKRRCQYNQNKRRNDAAA